MAIVGVSPRPTEAPGLNGIPPELRRRQDVQWPPPANWCGFVNSIYGGFILHQVSIKIDVSSLAQMILSRAVWA